MHTEPPAFNVPARVVWTVALFLAAWTLGGLYYAGRVVSQLERAVDELAAVKVVQTDHDRRIRFNREELIRMGANGKDRTH